MTNAIGEDAEPIHNEDGDVEAYEWEIPERKHCMGCKGVNPSTEDMGEVKAEELRDKFEGVRTRIDGKMVDVQPDTVFPNVVKCLECGYMSRNSVTTTSRAVALNGVYKRYYGGCGEVFSIVAKDVGNGELETLTHNLD